MEETVEKVKLALKILHAFRTTYEEHRAKIKEYFAEGEEVKEWEFSPHLVFHRFDKFLERVETVKVRFFSDFPHITKVIIMFRKKQRAMPFVNAKKYMNRMEDKSSW